MNTDFKELNRLRDLQEKVARQKNISVEALRRMLSKVDEYSETQRGNGLPDDLLNILKDDVESELVSF